MKTLEDIKSYIKKSPRVANEQELLKHLPEPAQWPQSVTSSTQATSVANLSSPKSATIVPSPAYQLGYSTDGHLFNPSARTGLRNADSDEPVQDTHDSSFEPRIHPEAHLSISSRYTGPYIVDPSANMTRQDEKQPLRFSQESQGTSGWHGFQYHTTDVVPQLHTYNSQEQYFDAQVSGGLNNRQTFEIPWEDHQTAFDAIYEPFEAQGQDLSLHPNFLGDFHLAASVTPRQLPPGSDTDLEVQTRFQEYVAKLLSTGQDLRNQPAKSFFKSCCEAMIFHGQDQRESCSQAVEAASVSFQRLIADHASYRMSLPVLNMMSFVFEAYGQKLMKKRILQRLQQATQEMDELKRIVVLGSIDFLLDTADWSSDKAATKLAKTSQVYTYAVETAGQSSQLAISARYNHAWTLLEAGKPDQALSILNGERSKCETAFGIHSLQTITWIATQARAHLKNGEPLSAEAVMTESALTRAEKAFSQDHPIYWEVMYRIGLFLLNFASNNSLPDRTEFCWVKGEEMVRQTLVWRAQWLGPENPRTATAYKDLKFYLEKQGKNQDATALYSWYRAEAGL